MESAPYEKVPLNEKQLATFKKYFKQDYYIYDHFKKIFEAKVKKFGRRKMARKVAELKKLYEICNEKPDHCNFYKPERETEDTRNCFLIFISHVTKLISHNFVNYGYHES